MDLLRHAMVARGLLVVALLLAPLTAMAAPMDCGMMSTGHGDSGHELVLVDQGDCCEPGCEALCAAHATLITPTSLAVPPTRAQQLPLRQAAPRAGYPLPPLRPPLPL